MDAAIARADAEIAARVAELEKRLNEIRASSETDAREVAREVTAELVRHFGGTPDPSEIEQAVDTQMRGVLQ